MHTCFTGLNNIIFHKSGFNKITVKKQILALVSLIFLKNKTWGKKKFGQNYPKLWVKITSTSWCTCLISDNTHTYTQMHRLPSLLLFFLPRMGLCDFGSEVGGLEGAELSTARAPSGTSGSCGSSRLPLLLPARDDSVVPLESAWVLLECLFSLCFWLSGTVSSDNLPFPFESVWAPELTLVTFLNVVLIEAWSSLPWLLLELQFCCVPSFAADGLTVDEGTVTSGVSTKVFSVGGAFVEEFFSLRFSAGRVCVSTLSFRPSWTGGSAAVGLSGVAVWLDRVFSVERSGWVSGGESGASLPVVVAAVSPLGLVEEALTGSSTLVPFGRGGGKSWATPDVTPLSAHLTFGAKEWVRKKSD